MSRIMKIISRLLRAMLVLFLAFCVMVLCLIFYWRYEEKKTYSDRTTEQMDETIRLWFGDDTERVDIIPCEDSDNSLYIYRLNSVHEDTGPFYIAAINTFSMNNNLFAQLLKSNAVGFWRERDRDAVLVSTDGGRETPLDDELNSIENVLDTTDWRLSVYCRTSEDFEACAEELDEWFDYCMQDKRMYRDDSSYYPNRNISGRNPVLEVEIRMEDTRFWIEMDRTDMSIKGEEGRDCKETILQLLETEYKNNL